MVKFLVKWVNRHIRVLAGLYHSNWLTSIWLPAHSVYNVTKSAAWHMLCWYKWVDWPVHYGSATPLCPKIQLSPHRPQVDDQTKFRQLWEPIRTIMIAYGSMRAHPNQSKLDYYYCDHCYRCNGSGTYLATQIGYISPCLLYQHWHWPPTLFTSWPGQEFVMGVQRLQLFLSSS